MPTIQRDVPTSQGRCLSNRYQFRRFKHADAMHKFLNKGDNALFWKESTHDMPSGIYASQVGYDRAAGKPTIKFTKVG